MTTLIQDSTEKVTAPGRSKATGAAGIGPPRQRTRTGGPQMAGPVCIAAQLVGGAA
jgi:hypothetical protein